MNEQFFLKLLLVLFAGLIVAELIVVTISGLKLELILLCFIIAVALTGIVIVGRLLLQQRQEVESVSMRRERQKSAGVMQDRLRNYAVDHEFMSPKGSSFKKGEQVDTVFSAQSEKNDLSAPPALVSIDELIRSYAERYGGFGSLLQAINHLDDVAFGKLMLKAGAGHFSREELTVKISHMAGEECLPIGDSNANAQEYQTPLTDFSLDKESFDEYIQRSMNTAEKKQEDDGNGFCVELDSEALSRGIGVPPSDFSHDPNAVFSKLKKTSIFT
ncbi:MAG: hypothetical protein WCK32_00240 [Chlorobiaceae bacterium]